MQVRLFLFAILFYFIWVNWLLAADKVIISGTISDSTTGEALIGVNIWVEELKQGTVTNQYGYYSLSLPNSQTSYTVKYSYIGYQSIVKVVNVNKPFTGDIRLSSTINELQEIVISEEAADVQNIIRSTDIGNINLSVKELNKFPAFAGEADLMKVAQLMPGVKSGTQGNAAFYVRGGAPDQNLILLDEAIVYNPSHLLGFFSVFNTDALKNVNIIKGGFPANYGGRLASIMDIKMKEGNKDKLTTTGAIGLLSSKLTVEGPVTKKSSFIISGRRSYVNQVMKIVNKRLPYYFYDINAKFNYQLSENDKLYFSTYLGRDILNHANGSTILQSEKTNVDVGLQLGNYTNTIRWNHLYKNNKQFSNVSLITTKFNYNINALIANEQVDIKSKIQDIGLKVDFDYYYQNDNLIKYGGQYIHHIFNPNIINTSIPIEGIQQNPKNSLSTDEYIVYALNDRDINNKLKINYGARYTLISTTNKFYHGIEPRFNARFLLNENRAIKFGYSRMYQYMHMVSSSSVILPTDLWYPVSKRIAPQLADQLTLSYSVKLNQIKSNFSVETYYKWMNNLVSYKEGAVLVFNKNFEDELLQGKGNAHGLEFMFQKQEGKWTGWIAYTLAYATRQFDQINNGKLFFDNYDRRHDFSTVLNYDINKTIEISSIFILASGTRFTPIVGQFVMPNAGLYGIDVLPIYGARNSEKLPFNHRLDINLTIKGKTDKKFYNEIQIGAYNVYNRTQPYKVDVIKVENQYKYVQRGLIGFLPYITYNFKF